MKILGLMLVLLGMLVVVDGGISYDRQRTALAAGPIQATVSQRGSVTWTPIVGAITLVGGALLLAIPRRRLARVLPGAKPRS